MLRLQKWSINPFRLLHAHPWPVSAAVAPAIDPSQVVEEENTPYYDTRRFYPTQLSEVFKGRYQIATKLGHGSSSTVWLARDLFQWRCFPDRYVTIKINAIDRSSKGTAENELRVSQLLSRTNPRHEGWHFIRTLEDSFRIKGSSGDHICLVFEPLREPLWLLKRRFEGNAIPSWLLKIMFQMMLHGLDYLHRVCHTVHHDLKPDNILVKLEDKSILERSAHDEFDNPLPQKKCADRTIYLARNDYGQPASVTGITSIVDFGLSVTGNGPHYGCVQAKPYRAPEVILDAGWTYSSDIWSLGVMVWSPCRVRFEPWDYQADGRTLKLWDLLEDKILFVADDPLKTNYDDQTHLAHIAALLGPPPQELLARGRRTSMFYNSEGGLTPAMAIPTPCTFEDSVTRISGEEKTMFLKFVRRMLTWEPKDRSTAKELLDDPWLYKDFPQDTQ